MATLRKMHSDIERTLKLVSSGIEEFDRIWEKVYSRDAGGQREKFEADLKKEIKKLQKYRDMIKGWISSSEIKDKGHLIEARSAIEREMERFKVCEKEAKTKAYSQAGLERDSRNPLERERGRVTEWLQDCIWELNKAVEIVEGEIETLSSSGGGKKKQVKINNERTQIFLNKLEAIRFHLSKLELIQRLVDNGELEPESVEELRESVEYYIENHAEPEFVDDDTIYDALDLEGYKELGMVKDLTSIKQPVSIGDKAFARLGPEGRSMSSDLGSSVRKTSMIIAAKQGDKKVNSSTAESTHAVPMQGHEDGGNMAPLPGISSGVANPTGKSGMTTESGAKAVAIPAAHGVPKSPPRAGEVGKGAVEVVGSSRTTAVPLGAVNSALPRGPSGAGKDSAKAPALHSSQMSSAGGLAAATQLSPEVSPLVAPTGSSWVNYSGAAGKLPLTAVQSPGKEDLDAEWHELFHAAVFEANSRIQREVESHVEERAQTGEAPDTWMLEMFSLGFDDLQERIKDEREGKAAAIAAASHHQQETAAMELTRMNLNRNSAATSSDGKMPLGSVHKVRHPAVHTPESFPLKIPEAMMNGSLFPKMDTDALFFAFYHQQGTQAQGYASRELKRGSWRYHKKYCTWFQRHEEPKVTTEEYEHGTYVYFDYHFHEESNSGWCKRIKTEFTFEYDYLEDEVLLL